jgi:tRNA(adenine34) deaminase
METGNVTKGSRPGKSQTFMELALGEAEVAANRGEVPVGAVIVRENMVIAQAGNRVVELNDPTAHAELLVIRQACAALDNARLEGCDLYVTLEPCAMCAAAISFARIRRLYYGAGDQKGGAVEHGPCFFAQPTCHHTPEVYGGIDEVRSADLLKAFFAERR